MNPLQTKYRRMAAACAVCGAAGAALVAGGLTVWLEAGIWWAWVLVSGGIFSFAIAWESHCDWLSMRSRYQLLLKAQDGKRRARRAQPR